MEVMGTISAITGIIDVATRSISTLTEVRRRYKGVSFAIELLSGQLVAVRTALDQIRHLIEESLQDDQHYQLVMNMDVAINSCNLLIRVLDEQISKLEYSENDKLTFESRVKMVIDSKGTDECLTRLDRQMSALNLIITAYNARIPTQQKELMERKESRKIFAQVRDDSSSLCVLCDSASFVTKGTRTTAATSKFSTNFAFDPELLQHRAYKSTFRSLLRRIAARQSRGGKGETISMSNKPYEDKASRSIDQKLQEDSRRIPEMNVLVLGADGPKIIRNMKIAQLNEEERMSYRPMIYKHLLSNLQTVMVTAAYQGITESTTFEYHKRVLDSISTNDVVSVDDFGPKAFKSLCWSVTFYFTYLKPESPGSYFLEEAKRIMEPNYIPSEADILRTASKITEISEVRLPMGERSIHLTHMNRSMPRSTAVGSKYFDSVIFAVDIASYDYIPLRGVNRSYAIMESLAEFEYLSSGWFRQCPIVLLLCNIAGFKAKLSRSPLNNVFPEYSGGDDANRAVAYILGRFNLANSRGLERYPARTLHPYLVEPDDPTNMRLIIGKVKELNLSSALAKAGLKTNTS